ncbi:Uncharacterised protein [Mycobacteroides abscessus subsp. massiliense]|nr:Uncharacterised protein [Mycobacteroides abscessus subsp. massiliense]SLB76724.1 Uncharacterised protein [Mycobacteroides abscessus subsp. massiliense]SLE93973.1 Uncharacterised protein [Mycobacteroides abscessus subsp. massiliense]SLG55573.1 Uncharacterised protein [Mycobacteroides abscessus subsp. massiliense]SLH16855.1 Uncharacterised protein [Mycobacteroides abscessus subsp. massiliense]
MAASPPLPSHVAALRIAATSSAALAEPAARSCSASCKLPISAGMRRIWASINRYDIYTPSMPLALPWSVSRYLFSAHRYRPWWLMTSL